MQIARWLFIITTQDTKRGHYLQRPNHQTAYFIQGDNLAIILRLQNALEHMLNHISKGSRIFDYSSYNMKFKIIQYVI